MYSIENSQKWRTIKNETRQNKERRVNISNEKRQNKWKTCQVIHSKMRKKPKQKSIEQKAAQESGADQSGPDGSRRKQKGADQRRAERNGTIQNGRERNRTEQTGTDRNGTELNRKHSEKAGVCDLKFIVKYYSRHDKKAKTKSWERMWWKGKWLSEPEKAAKKQLCDAIKKVTSHHRHRHQLFLVSDELMSICSKWHTTLEGGSTSFG